MIILNLMHAYYMYTCTHRVWAYLQRVSTTFLTEKLRSFCCVPDRVWTSGHEILSLTLYQLSHHVHPLINSCQFMGFQRWSAAAYIIVHGGVIQKVAHAILSPYTCTLTGVNAHTGSPSVFSWGMLKQQQQQQPVHGIWWDSHFKTPQRSFCWLILIIAGVTGWLSW